MRNQGQRWLVAALRHSTHRHPSGSWKSSLSLLPIRALQERAQGQRVGPDSSQPAGLPGGEGDGTNGSSARLPGTHISVPMSRGGDTERRKEEDWHFSSAFWVSDSGPSAWERAVDGTPPLPALQDGTVPLHRGGSESRSVVSDSLRPHGLYGPWNSPGENTRVDSLSLLQGIFPTQGSTPGLPHCR